MSWSASAGTSAASPVDWRDRALSLERGWVLTAAITSLLFGFFIILRPTAGLSTLAVIFGSYLVVAGVSRVAFAIAGRGHSTGRRLLMALLGVIIAIAGFACLLDFAASLEALAFILGAGLVVAGIADVATIRQKVEGRPTALRVVSAILSIIAGIVMFVIPFVSVGLIVLVGAIALVVVGIAGIVAYPQMSLYPLTD